MGIRATPILVEPFYILVSNLLTLLLPLSFLLLSRVATQNYFYTLGGEQLIRRRRSSDLIFSEHVFHTTRPIINLVIHLVVSILSIASLSHGLSSKLGRSHRQLPARYSGARLHASWFLLCVVQVCVGIGIEESIASGVEYGESKGTTGFVSRVIFFLGLHETMMYWSRVVVKPVVDETVYGEPKKDGRWVEKVAVAASFGGLWWWRLRDEVEAMVGVVEAKKVLLMEIGILDFVGWWLYYLTVTIGIVKVVKSTLWVGIILLFERRSVEANPDHHVLHYYRDDHDDNDNDHDDNDNEHELKV
ncbi:uncharacterized protein LOC124916627 [Impatiens glandulifera]|uniref:uncharacterized protein LOC124916627 n=1 Tax=Impatiens glandulifera TaxID=253017 RepID=UPI001FB1456A|nr:uncharacterized protein LOC124916627 [Impatiens glandulifera]